MAEELPEWKQEGLQVFEEVEQKIKEDEKKERWRKIKNLVNNKGYTLKEYDQQIQLSFVRDIDSVIQKLNSTFQQDLKDEAEAESFYIA